MWPSGMTAGGSGQIPVAPAVVWAGEGGEKGQGVTFGRFVPEVGIEVALVVAWGGSRRR
jgi:hypothetical protein